MRTKMIFTLSLLTLMASAQDLRAQTSIEQVAAPAVAPTPIVGPVASHVRAPLLAERALNVELAPENANNFQSTDRNNVAWMTVGAAALVVGLMIGGDGGTIVAIVGGVIGLTGLFRYMQ